MEKSDCVENSENEKSECSTSGVPDAKKKRRSPVWDHFHLVSGNINNNAIDFAQCNYCSKRYQYSGKGINGSTGNLNNHLKTKHPDMLLVATPNSSENSTAAIEFSQEIYRNALLKWMVEREQSVHEVQHPVFLEVVRSLNPFAEEISPATLQRDLIAEYEERAKSIKLKLSRVPGKLSFTITKVLLNNYWFLKVEAHWIDNWKPQSDLLDFCQMQEENFSSNTCDLFFGCLNRFDIPLSKILGITMQNVSGSSTFTDSLHNRGISNEVNISTSANFVESLRDIINSSIQPLLSTLSEVKNDEEEAMSSENEAVTNATPLIKVRNLVLAIRGSNELQQEMKEMCVLMGVQFNLPVIDENLISTLQLIDTVFHLQQPLRALCAKKKTLSKLMISEAEWNEINVLKKLLLKFHRAADFVHIHSYLATLNWLVDSVDLIVKEHHDEFNCDALNVCLAKMKQYHKELSNSKILYIATLLNPALKISYFKEHNYSKSNVKEIEKDVHDIFKQNYEVKGGTTSSDKSDSEDDELFSHMFKRAKSDKLSKEFQKYLRHPLSSPKCDVLEFWKLNEPEYPCLSRMARDYLGIPSSVQEKILAEEAVTTDHVRATNCLRYWFKQNK